MHEDVPTGHYLCQNSMLKASLKQRVDKLKYIITQLQARCLAWTSYWNLQFTQINVMSDT